MYKSVQKWSCIAVTAHMLVVCGPEPSHIRNISIIFWMDPTLFDY